MSAHHDISEMFGRYKISLHSDSDKFSIYPLAAEATEGLVHLKTSGTSYLCALEVIARHDAPLLARIWDISRAAYRSEEHTSELQSRGHLVCRLLLEKKNTQQSQYRHEQ